MLEGKDISGRVDLLSKFLSAKSNDGKLEFDDQYLLDVLKNFLIAGRDTTAVCLSWTFYLLTQHPDVERKVLDEIHTVVGENPEDITYENLNKLKYMRQVIDESLRLYPPVPYDERTTVNEDILPSGYVIPANTTVVYSAYAAHRLHDYYKDPTTFNPDRWTTDSIKPFSFVAFHGGPRICLGQNMAYQEVKVAMCTILQRFTFERADNSPVTYKLSLTMPIKNGLKVYPIPRKNS